MLEYRSHDTVFAFNLLVCSRSLRRTGGLRFFSILALGTSYVSGFRCKGSHRYHSIVSGFHLRRRAFLDSSLLERPLKQRVSQACQSFLYATGSDFPRLSSFRFFSIDATFVCFNIDLDIGHTDHQEAYDAFAYEDEQSQNAEPEEELTYGMSGLYRSDSGESV